MLARDALLVFMAMTAFLALSDARLQMVCATTQSLVMEHASARMVSPVLHAPPAPQATSGLARHVNPAPVVAAAERCAREKALAMAMGFRSEQVSVHASGGLLDRNATRAMKMVDLGDPIPPAEHVPEGLPEPFALAMVNAAPPLRNASAMRATLAAVAASVQSV